MKKYKVSLLKGDGIGPEVTEATCTILDAADAPFEWEEAPAGLQAVEQYGVPMPQVTLDAVRRNRLGLKGPLQTPKGRGFRSANVTLRQELNLFVGFRPVKTIPGIKTPYSDVDLIILRENTEGLYSGIEHKINSDMVMTIKTSTKKAGKKIANWAFEYMRYNGRRKIQCCHKSPVVPLADGAFLDAFFDAKRPHQCGTLPGCCADWHGLMATPSCRNAKTRQRTTAFADHQRSRHWLILSRDAQHAILGHAWRWRGD